MDSEFFCEKIIAAILYGFRNVKKPVSVTVHPEVMRKIRERFENKLMAPKSVGGVEMFFGLKVHEDATKDKDYISVE